MNAFGFEPDFGNLKKVLKGGRGERVPNAELVIDREIQEAFLGRPVKSPADEVEFRYQAGYDYAWVSVGMVDPAGTVNKDLVREKDQRAHAFAGKDERRWADEGTGRIASHRDLEAFPWPDPATLDYSPFDRAARALHPGMKIIAVLGKVFTAAWQLTGLEHFCLMALEEPSATDALLERIGDIQLGVLRRVLDMDCVGAVWCPDDVAFQSGPLMPVAWLREKIFPWYARMAALCRQTDKPIIYHSDGDMMPLLDTIIETGFDALHPIEPESMDIYEVRRRAGPRLCLIGNIAVHALATDTPQHIREMARERIERLGRDGAYCLGSSNSVPHYAKIENYRAMLQAGADFGKTA